MRKLFNIKLFFLSLLSLSGCFTGIEGTPKITSSDVKKENIQVTPEHQFLSDIKSERPSKWIAGKRFHIIDKRIYLLLDSPQLIDTANLKGKELFFQGIDSTKSVTGETKGIIKFIIDSGQEVTLNTDQEYDDLNRRQNYEIPFAVDHDIISAVGERMIGRTYYITTPNWIDLESGKHDKGLRHVAVEIVDVQPGTWNYPIKVVFVPKDSDVPHYVLMTIGDKRSSTQNFDTLFSFDNPRTKYPYIEDDVWQLIMNSKVKRGMSKDECRLALGTPSTRGQFPTTAGMAEYWSYAEGIYLLFEDGYLTGIR